MAQLDKLAEIRFPARSNQLQHVREQVRRAVRQQECFPSDTIHCVVLAVDEACSNVIRHAYGAECDDEIVLEVFADRDAMTFRITDFANPVDLHAVRPRTGEALFPGGFGIRIIHQVMDKVEFMGHPEHAGNVLLMAKRIERP